MDRLTGRALLVASLSLNLFLVAAFGAMIAWGVHRAHHMRSTAPLRLGALSLDTPHKDALLNLLRTDGRTVRPYVIQARMLRTDAWRSLESPDFDPVAAKAKLARARALNETASAQVQNSVIDFAAALPIDQRASLGRALTNRLARPFHILKPGAPARRDDAQSASEGP